MYDHFKAFSLNLWSLQPCFRLQNEASPFITRPVHRLTQLLGEHLSSNQERRHGVSRSSKHLSGERVDANRWFAWLKLFHQTKHHLSILPIEMNQKWIVYLLKFRIFCHKISFIGSQKDDSSLAGQWKVTFPTSQTFLNKTKDFSLFWSVRD